MRTFLLTALAGIAVLNCFLGYVCQGLVDMMVRRYGHLGMPLPYLTIIAMKLPVWFYAVMFVALVVLFFGYLRRLEENKLMYWVIVLMAFDIAGLFVTTVGYALPMMGVP